MGFFLAGALGTLVLMALTRRDEFALWFGAMAMLAAGVLGVLSRRDRLGRAVALSVAALVTGLALAGLVLADGLELLGRPRARAEAERMKAVLEVEAARARLEGTREVRSEPPAPSVEVSTNASVAPAAGSTGQRPSQPAQEEEAGFVVQGRVTDAGGSPLAGVEVRAACGIGTLMPAGRTHSDGEGRYRLEFEPGFRSSVAASQPHGVRFQSATITVTAPGWFETNLCRQGNLAMTDSAETPARAADFVGVVRWGEPRTLDFVLQRSATVVGILRDGRGAPLRGREVGLSGMELPPSASVLATARTDAEGRFRFTEVPVGRRWWLESRAGLGGPEVRSEAFVAGNAAELEFEVVLEPGRLRIKPR